MEEHEDKAMHQHLRMMMRLMQLKQPPAAVTATPNKQLEYLVNLPPVEFLLTDFTKGKECNTEWTSPPFYSHPHGHKFCLLVFPNGYESLGTHLSVGVLFLESDNGTIDWPLEVGFVVILCNWRDDKQHYQEVIELSSASNLVTKKGIKRSPIYKNFIPHSSLSYNSTTNTEYLQNDCVRLRVSKVILYSTALLNKTPSWQNLYNGYQSLHEFTLTEFSKHKEFDHRHLSLPFYTHQAGYKFSIRVHANGCGNSKGTHISVFVYQLAGEFDDQLEWPFVGKFVIELLNWRENKSHCKMTLSIVAKDEFVKVTEGMFGKSYGFFSFISHSSLVYDPLQDIEYLQDDCLRFRVNMKTN